MQFSPILGLDTNGDFFAQFWLLILQDFLGLVDKFYYLSGNYDLQLTVGDAVMVSQTLPLVFNLFYHLMI